MNEETMRKHYERTPKETLINILISSREQVDKLQRRNKELKQEIERLNNALKEYDRGTYCKLINENRKLNNIINELEKDLEEKIDEDRLNILSNSHWKYVLDKLQELKGEDKE